ncbi:unnamed protein product [Linum tenue]|uniref:CP12 domain-containing protein n=1 Tax=Linum tenue TaxID=586396 RepID=A0AAV0PG43_9ROSI|nr:unnamed protein product [Linum tenue]
MAAMAAGLSTISTAPASWKVMAESPRSQPQAFLSMKQHLAVGATTKKGGRLGGFRPVMAAPDQIQSKVEESIKGAEETCAEDPASGECVAAWDEVEELSAAASHARDKAKSSDPLEAYCKDNPETDECRTYDN